MAMTVRSPTATTVSARCAHTVSPPGCARTVSPPGCARAGLAVLLVLTTIPACSGAAKRETSALYDAVDRYRGADESAKLARGQAVAAVECTVASVCDVKRVCLAAIDPTTRALQLKDEVARRVGDIEKNHLEVISSEAQALSSKLDEAAKLLEAGRLKMSECERRLIDLRVHRGG
jgi:hypothetical protein